MIAFIDAFVISAEQAKADFIWGTPTNLGPTVNSSRDDFGPEISADGLVMYIGTDRPGGLGDTDVWVSTRQTKNDEWDSPVHLEGPLNTSYSIWEVSLTADGLQLYCSDGPFSATWPGGDGNGDVWVASRSSTSEPFGVPVILPAIINSDHAAWADISPDGLELYITSHRTGSIGNCDIWMAKRASKDSPWGSPVNLGSTVNSGPPDQAPDISYDGLTLFWAKGQGPDGMDLWMARRKDPSQPFEVGVRLPDGVNTAMGEFGSCLSPDGTVIYFSSNRAGGFGGFDIWQVSITPIVDFNGDGIVNLKDFAGLAQYWKQNEAGVDIGPTPLGDGRIDYRDLAVFAEHFRLGGRPKQASGPNPYDGATGVSMTASLSWTAGDRAESHEVYFGTGYPLPLVSTETDTTYAPPVMAKTTTYYWRIDEVNSKGKTTGETWSFITETGIVW